MQAQQRAAAVAFQSPKYIQQAGALSHVGAFARECFPAAQRAALILSARSRAQHGEALCASLPSPLIAEFSGECSRAALASLVAKLAAHELSYVVGFGGGKLLDMAKLVAHELDLPVVVVPSLASTDAPCTALSVVYSDAGAVEEVVFFPRSPALVVVDTAVIAEAPARYLIAGMGDAMATWYEARAVMRNPAAATKIAPCTYRPPRIAAAICRECADILYEVTAAGLSCRIERLSTAVDGIRALLLPLITTSQLMVHGVQAAADCAARRCSEALEAVVEANILLSGLGVEAGGLAVAHGLHNALTRLQETHPLMHGQKVAFGTLVQLVLEGDAAEAQKLAAFNQAVGLPLCLADLHLAPEDTAKLDVVVSACLAKGGLCLNMPQQLSHEGMMAAILGADALGRATRAAAAAAAAAAP